MFSDEIAKKQAMNAQPAFKQQNAGFAPAQPKLANSGDCGAYYADGVCSNESLTSVSRRIDHLYKQAQGLGCAVSNTLNGCVQGPENDLVGGVPVRSGLEGRLRDISEILEQTHRAIDSLSSYLLA